MGRKRSVDQNQILDAVEAVVIESGVAKLTVEAVAKKAGISKATVLYDFKSKEALINALIKRHFSCYDQLVADEQAKGLSFMSANVEVIRRHCGDDERAVSLAVCASMANNQSIREQIVQYIWQDIKALNIESLGKPNLSLAYLAMHGLCSLEMLGVFPWNEDQRQQILNHIDELAKNEAEEPTHSI